MSTRWETENRGTRGTSSWGSSTEAVEEGPAAPREVKINDSKR
jgi:hypothetical protein